MQFDECEESGHRIYAGADEVPEGGFTASVAVRDLLVRPPRDAWREDRLAGGHRWPTAQMALDYALRRGREWVRRRRRLANLAELADPARSASAAPPPDQSLKS